MTPDCASCGAKVGKVVLFIGNECEHWTPEEFANAAKEARAWGVDTIAPKRMNGGQRWYDSPAHLAAERAAVLAEGCGYLPFGYCYGPAFNDQQIREECAILAEIMRVNDGIVCADMEAEWNGYVSAAQLFESLMRPVPGQLVISTWADPLQQNWAAVVRALAPCVDAWGPQQYNNWLAAQESTLVGLGETCLQPEIDLSQEFGPNNPVQIAEEARARGHTSIYLWELGFARGDPALVEEIVHAFKG